MIRKTPWVRLKMAASLMARQRWRMDKVSGSPHLKPAPTDMPGARACAVLTGINDGRNPRLDVREVYRLCVVVVDSR
jgi:hypothetical protein